MKIRAAIARTAGEPFVIDDCELGTPGPGEALVEIKACGICHTDLAAKDHGMGTPLPAVLGHEGTGVIMALGEGVSDFAVGDHVLMSFGACGSCPTCTHGAPAYCHHLKDLNLLGRRLDGSTPIQYQGQPITGHYFAQSSFATHAVARTNNMVKLGEDLPHALMAPLACGVQTGMASVMLALEAKPGSSIAIFGCGSVGLAAVMAAKIAGCRTIVAVDINDSRLELATELGATHVLNSSRDAITKSLWKLGGMHNAFDCTGLPEVIESAFMALLPQGTLVCAGVSKPGTRLSLDMGALLYTGRRVRGTIEGDAVPREFIPRMLAWYREGRLPLEKLVTTYRFDDINTAVADFKAGRIVKAVLTL